MPIRTRRSERALFIQKLQHALPSIVVLGDGLEHLSHEPQLADLVLGGVEVVASLLVIGTVIHGVRALQKRTAPSHEDQHAHHGIDWIDICLGVMLSVEAYATYHASGHIPRPTLLLAATMFTIGLAHGRIAAFGDARRVLRVGPDGLSVPSKPFRRLSLTWPEVASIDCDDRWAVVTALDGRRRRIDLHDVLQPNAVRDALRSASRLLDDARHAANASIESNPSAG